MSIHITSLKRPLAMPFVVALVLACIAAAELPGAGAQATDATGPVALTAKNAARVAVRSVVNIFICPIESAPLGNGVDRAVGCGSGVVVTEDGLVVTNRHVAIVANQRDQTELRATDIDGHTYAAVLLSDDPESDLALLRISGRDKLPPAIHVGRSEALELGEEVVAIGNPFGRTSTVTRGIISSMKRTITVRDSDGTVRSYSNLLQTDAAINPGNSGGALVTFDGALVGICNAGMPAADNLGYAIPSSTVSRVIAERLIEKASRLGCWFGCTFEETEGVLVLSHLVRGGPMERAGVVEGARMVAAGGKGIANLRELREVLSSRGKSGVSFVLLDKGAPHNLVVRPLDEGAGRTAEALGLEFSPTTVQELSVDHKTAILQFLRKRPDLFGTVDFDSCNKVERVYPGSTSADAGLVVGDVIIAWGVDESGLTVSGLGASTAIEAAAGSKGGMLTVYVLRPGATLQGRLVVKH